MREVRRIEERVPGGEVPALFQAIPLLPKFGDIDLAEHEAGLVKLERSNPSNDDPVISRKRPLESCRPIAQ